MRRNGLTYDDNAFVGRDPWYKLAIEKIQKSLIANLAIDVCVRSIGAKRMKKGTFMRNFAAAGCECRS